MKFWSYGPAHKALGDKLDIRAFHDEVLDAGALPLDVLRRGSTPGSRGKREAQIQRNYPVAKRPEVEAPLKDCISREALLSR